MTRHTHFGCHLVSAAVLAITLFPAPSSAATDDYAPFVFLDIGYPPGMDTTASAVLTVADINDDGAIVGYYPVSSTEWAAFYWFDGFWFTYEDPDEASAAFWGINNLHHVVGWRGPIPQAPDATGLVFLDIAQAPTEINDTRAVDINDEGVVVGNSDTTDATAWIATSQFLSLPKGGGADSWVSCLSHGSPTLPTFIGGLITDSSNDQHGVVWRNQPGQATAEGPFDLGGADTVVTDVNDAVANQSTAIGNRHDGAGALINGLLWLPAGSDLWNEAVLTGLKDPKRINNFDEVVGDANAGRIDPRLWVNPITTAAPSALDLTTLAHAAPSDVTSFEATVINDAGLIAGTAAMLPIRSNCLLVPYDVDNDGVPDYREILTGQEPDIDGDLYIDYYDSPGPGSAGYLRPGLHAPGLDGTLTATKALEIENTQVARLILTHGQIHCIVNNISSCIYRETLPGCRPLRHGG